MKYEVTGSVDDKEKSFVIVTDQKMDRDKAREIFKVLYRYRPLYPFQKVVVEEINQEEEDAKR